jgi:hypothetical protein
MMKGGPGGRVPAFLSIDVEPDGLQPRGAAGDWSGWDTMFDFCEWLRSSLAERTGERPSFGWYFRTDPQIGEVYGRSDHVMVAYPERMRTLASRGDYFGVHAHTMRWCEVRRLWVHDLADAKVIADCTTAALGAFAGWAGSPARYFRAGAGFVTNEIIEIAERSGVLVDLSLEPVAGWGLSHASVPTTIDESPMLGDYTNCHGAPRVVFHPAYHDFRVADERGGRRLVMVPLTTIPTAALRRRSLLERLLGRIARREGEVKMLYPTGTWGSPQRFWNLAEWQLQRMRRPYLSLAIRTDPVEFASGAAVRRIFEALPDHPLARRLRFDDPLVVAPTLI